jgi:hypothetical protein
LTPPWRTPDGHKTNWAPSGGVPASRVHSWRTQANCRSPLGNVTQEQNVFIGLVPVAGQFVWQV